MAIFIWRCHYFHIELDHQLYEDLMEYVAKQIYVILKDNAEFIMYYLPHTNLPQDIR